MDGPGHPQHNPQLQDSTQLEKSASGHTGGQNTQYQLHRLKGQLERHMLQYTTTVSCDTVSSEQCQLDRMQVELIWLEQQQQSLEEQGRLSWQELLQWEKLRRECRQLLTASQNFQTTGKGAITLPAATSGYPVSAEQLQAFDRNVLHSYENPDRLHSLFKSSSQVHYYLHRHLRALSGVVTASQLKTIQTVLDKLRQDLITREASAEARESFQRLCYGKFQAKTSGPSMSANEHSVVKQVQERLLQEQHRLVDKMKEMVLQESVVLHNQDLAFMQEKARVISLLKQVSGFIDNPAEIARHLHFFTGHGYGVETVCKHLDTAANEIRELKQLLQAASELTDDDIELLEQRLEDTQGTVAQMNRKLSDLHYHGWVGLDNEASERIHALSKDMIALRHKITRIRERVIDPASGNTLDRIQEVLEPMVKNLNAELGTNRPQSDLEQAAGLLKSGKQSWSREKWLQLNGLCNRQFSMVKNTIPEHYPVVSQLARAFSHQLVRDHQKKLDCFDLCASVELESAVRETWQEWEKNYPDYMTALQDSPLLNEWKQGSAPSCMWFQIREDIRTWAYQFEHDLSQGYLEIDCQVNVTEQFYQEIMDKVASRSRHYDQVVKLVNKDDQERLLRATVKKMEAMQGTSNTAAFPLIAGLSTRSAQWQPLESSCFPGICRWVEKSTGRSLADTEKWQVMDLFIQFRDELLRQVKAEH